MRYLPAATRHLRRLRTSLPAHRHARRRLLLAGRRDVARDVIGSRDADGVLRGGDVVRHAAGKAKVVLRAAGRGHRAGSPGCLYRCRPAAVH